MDEIDKKIIGFLSRDSRLTNTKIAELLNLSEGTVRRRVQSLVDSGIIKRFTIEVWEDRPKALLLLAASPSIPTSQIAEQILKIDGVESVFEVAGQYDISIMISGEDVATINRCIDNIRSISGIQNTYTLFILRKWK